MSDFDHFTGTRAVPEKQTFDIDALSAWLELNLPGFVGPLSVSRLKGDSPTPPTN